MRILLDTHIIVYWVSDPIRLTPAQQHVVQSVSSGSPAYVADISLWEIAMLVSGGRMRLDLRLCDWLARATAPPLVRIVEITPMIAATVAELQGWENRDPADRLIVATAMVHGCHLLTNDRAIRESKLVSVV